MRQFPSPYWNKPLISLLHLAVYTLWFLYSLCYFPLSFYSSTCNFSLSKLSTFCVNVSSTHSVYVYFHFAHLWWGPSHYGAAKGHILWLKVICGYILKVTCKSLDTLFQVQPKSGQGCSSETFILFSFTLLEYLSACNILFVCDIPFNLFSLSL